MNGESPVVTILPTGGGKTDCILILALLDATKTHVVVTPLVQLAKQLVEQCKNVWLSCVQWKFGLRRRATVVDIVTDAFVTDDCCQYLRDIDIQRKFGLLTFD